MLATISPGKISGSIYAPPSKSITQRVFAAALLHNGTTTINNYGESADERSALGIIKDLGAKVEYGNNNQTLIITSSGIPNCTSGAINCNESGLAARLFLPIAALCGQKVCINGTGSLLKRPMEGVQAAMEALGVTLNNFNGFLPIMLSGQLLPKDMHVDAGNSSQFLTGLLFALSSCATSPITLTVANLESKPYIDLTLDVLTKFGKPIKHNNYKEFYIDPSQFTISSSLDITIEGDWSSASFFLVAGAIAGETTVHNLDANTKQADAAILQLMERTGANISIASNGAITVTQSQTQSFDFDAADCPDLFPILAIYAALCRGESSIYGVHRLFHKESNRVESITEMLECFNVPFTVEDDTLYISGCRQLQGTVIDSYNDHRIAMAAAIGALRAGTQVDITNAGAINKSYPGFYKDLMGCGVGVELMGVK